MRKLAFLISLALAYGFVPARRVYLEDFFVKNSSLVSLKGEVVSSPDFLPKDWFKCRVPTTVLTCLVKNGVYPDPYVGLNNMKIPDAYYPYNLWYGLLEYSHIPWKNPWKSPYWFRTVFEEKGLGPGENLWLVLEGINYRAEMWVNGHRVAERSRVVGMFRRFRFNITPWVRAGINALAVKVYPPDFPGALPPPFRKNPNGGYTGDIGKNVTAHYSVGWDWVPPVRDRNTGLWGKVYLVHTGPVVLRNPWIKTKLSPSRSTAYLTVSVDVLNSSGEFQRGTLEVLSGKIRLKKRIALGPGERKTVAFSFRRHRSLVIRRPKLWWPRGYGEQNLYRMTFIFKTRRGISHIKMVNFGIREITTRLEYVDGFPVRYFYINGRKIFLRGGAWVPDMMLRRDSRRLARELELVKNANLNLVRIWGGGVTPPGEFFDLTDKLGLLVWHDFWITGDCQGTWGKGSRDWPLEADVFLKNAEDVVLRLRNHPSLFLWSGGNEAYPGKRIYLPLRNEIIKKLDGTRPFVPSSGITSPPPEWGLSLPDDGPSGLYSGGPYGWQEPEYYFQRVKEGKEWLFKDEVGVPSMPSLETIRRFLTAFTPDPTYRVPYFNEEWRYHFALYPMDGITRYGAPRSLREFVFWAQVMAAERYRAIFEAANTGISRLGGIMLWKLNPAWPELRWQIYDYYLNPIPAYYYIKKASSSLHIQLDLESLEVGVVNHQYERKKALKARIEVYDGHLNRVFAREKEFEIGPAQYKVLISLRQILPRGLHFVKLSLLGEGRVVSENFYWLSPEGDYSAFRRMGRAKIERKVRWEGRILKVQLRNTSPALAFFLGLSVRKSRGAREELRGTWSDNYFSLLPGEEKTVTWEPAGEPPKRPTFLKLTAWNFSAQIPLPPPQSLAFKSIRGEN